MSRIIVKGLPKYYTEKNLREFFSQKGEVTDVKLIKTKNGESRRFGFIGFRSFEDASNAVKYFNNSFIDTSRIEVSLAKSFVDPNVPIPYKKKRQMEIDKLNEQEERLRAQKEQASKRKKTSQINSDIEKNPELREFIEAMKPTNQVQSWSNDTLANGSGAPSHAKLLEELNKQGITDDYPANEMEEPKFASNNDNMVAKDVLPAGQEEVSEEMSEEETLIPLNEVAEDGLAANENISDLDWLKMRRRRMNDKTENEEGAPTTKSDSGNDSRNDPISNSEINKDSNEAEAEAAISAEDNESLEDTENEKLISQILQTGRLFIRNILYSSTEEDFRSLFGRFGELQEVHIAVDTRTGESKGFVYIQFQKSEDAVAAYKDLDKQIFQGRLLHILPAKEKKSHRLTEFDLKNLPLKKQRELKRKDQASKAQFSWNSLYMNSDAVLESVASNMGISKQELVNPHDSNSAVKQALAEAHVINDVRSFFESQGVDLTSFSKKERDDKIILVKNFPFKTTIEEIGELFSPFGELKRMIMPPAGTIAIIEFRDAPAARAAFSKLSYRSFKKTILYLEKGPKDLFNGKAPELPQTKDLSKDSDAVVAKTNAHELLETSTSEQELDGPSASVFIKNLNFSTTKEDLDRIFKPLQGYILSTIKTKPDPKIPGGKLSMGFGFAEFKTQEDASLAISIIDGHVLDGHKLQLKLSNRKQTQTDKKTKSSKKSSKVIIKNLPFEATRQDVFELFGAFGHLKSVRVPKKFDKSARGFAFVEFSLVKEAENAMNSLEGVHLLGRRLVMQYAEREAATTEAEIERMTKKVQKQVETQQVAAARLAGKGKMHLDEGEEDFEF